MTSAKTKKIYKCSVCKQPGHNKQNCPTAQLMRDKEVEHYIGILEALPLKETILSLLFIYAWKEAYGKQFRGSDIILGIVYGFTIPDALQGGTFANSYALGALAILGVGFLPEDVKDLIGDVSSGDIVRDALDELFKTEMKKRSKRDPLVEIGGGSSDIGGRLPYERP